MHIREQLEQTFHNLAGTFEKSTFDADLEKDVAGFRVATQNNPFPENLKKDLPLSIAYSSVGKSCAEKCESWMKRLCEYRQSMDFRDGFDNALVVYVYGKVKAGKSALGNFIAYGSHDPSQDQVNQQPNALFKVEIASNDMEADKAQYEKVKNLQEQMQTQKKFIVDMLEATNCIQYFNMPGLTWVDSPGIHSTTSANGELARQYLESADLIVFATSGRSACQKNDVKELAEIVKSKKPFVLAVTRCDESEQDVDENNQLINRLVMRSNEDMSDIRGYCIQTIGEAALEVQPDFPLEQLKQNTILLSCLYAEQNSDEQGWKDSGIEKFASRLIDIAQSDAKRIKLEGPLRSTYHQIETIREELKEISSEIDISEKEVKIQHGQLLNEIEKLSYKSRIELQKLIDSLPEECFENRNIFIKRVETSVQCIVEKARKDIVGKIIQGTEKMIDNLPFNTDLTGVPEFKDILKTTTYQTTKAKKGSLLGIALGTTIGGLFAGPAGGILGASLGVATGAFIGGKKVNEHSISIKVGDNRLEVSRKTSSKLAEDIRQDLCDAVTNLEETSILPLTQWLNQLKEHTVSLDNTLKAYEMKIAKRLGK